MFGRLEQDMCSSILQEGTAPVGTVLGNEFAIFNSNYYTFGTEIYRFSVDYIEAHDVRVIYTYLISSNVHSSNCSLWRNVCK